jgi:hypothetical protein
VAAVRHGRSRTFQDGHGASSRPPKHRIEQHVVSACHPAGVDQPRNFAASTLLQDHLTPFEIDFAGSMGVHYEVILKWRARRSRGFFLVDGIGVLVAKVSTVDTVDNPVEELAPGSGKS